MVEIPSHIYFNVYANPWAKLGLKNSVQEMELGSIRTYKYLHLGRGRALAQNIWASSSST